MQIYKNYQLIKFFKGENCVEKYLLIEFIRQITVDLKLIARFMNEFFTFRMLPIQIKVIFKNKNFPFRKYPSSLEIINFILFLIFI